MVARRVQHFTESVIREMTRLSQQHGAINLAQGMPDFEPPQEVKDAACKAIRDGYNQYAITWGAPALRQAIAAKARRYNGIDCDPDAHVTVCCGATECMIATFLALVDPGDEVVVFQPFYENYGPDALLAGARPVWVPLHPPAWRFDPDELRRAFTPRTRAVIVNTPNNPTGRVFTREELSFIADLCREHDAYAFADEIYEHILYTHRPHVSIATLPGMAERTVTISGLSKTFSVTGWRLGYCIAPPAISNAIRKAHDFLTVGAPHPLQMAGAAALALPDSYYDELRARYRHRRDLFLSYLRRADFAFTEPEGAYYVMTDAAALGAEDDREFVRRMIAEVGVAGVPGSSFHSPPELGRTKVRFMFSKRDETLHQAGERLLRLRSLV
jgi:aspartate/methionine/tyrosine aminotransferase